VSAFKPEQRRLTIRGRIFHFVSYEGQPANARRSQLPSPPMWFLMVEGRRCPVLPFDPDQSSSQVDAALSAWAEENALGPARPSPVKPITKPRLGAQDPRSDNWWGPD